MDNPPGGETYTSNITEGWNRHLRDLGPSLVLQEGEDIHNWLKRIDSILAETRAKSSIHVAHKWHTHIQESGCWICLQDLLLGLCHKYLRNEVTINDEAKGYANMESNIRGALSSIEQNKGIST